MIIKSITGNGFAGVAKYILEKPGRYIGGRAGDWQDFSAEAALLRAANPNAKNPVFHIFMAIAPGEFLTDEQWHEAAKSLLNHLGYTNNLYRAQMHIDKAHPHVHIFGSRIRSDNYKKVDVLRDKKKCFDYARILERRYGLTRLNQGKSPDPLRIDPRSQLRHHIDAATQGRPTYAQFQQDLAQQHIQVHPNISGTRVTGISFTFLGTRYKGSNLGKAYTWRKLAARLDFDFHRDLRHLKAKFTPPPRRPMYVGFARTFGRATAPNLTTYLKRSLAYYTALKKITPTPIKEDPPQDRLARERDR